MATKTAPKTATVTMIDRRPTATPEELSAYLQIPEKTLEHWRTTGDGPPWRRIGRHPRYRWTDVDAWWDEQEGSTP